MKLNKLPYFPAQKVWPLFNVILFFVCFFMSAVMPPLQSPDEPDHIKRAYFLTRGQIVLNAPEGQSSGGMIDSGLAAFIYAYDEFPFKSGRKLSSDEVGKANAIQWTGMKQFSPAPGTAYYFPLLYAPQAAGLIIGEVFKISVDKSVRLARFFSLLVASVIIYIAFRIYAPTPLVAALLVMPMSIFQLSSASLDVVLTAFSILAISAFMRIVAEKDNSKTWILYVLTASVLGVATSKVHLIPLLLLIFFTFFYTKSKKSLIAGSIASIFVILWMIVAIKTTVDKRVMAGLSVSSNLFFYISHPLEFIGVLLRTITNDEFTRFLPQSFFGILGWLDAPFSLEIYRYLYALFFLMLIFSTSFKSIKTEWPAMALLVFCAFGSILLIFLALLITWNVHPATVIYGIQGRYFLVPAFLLAYALNCSSRAKSGYFHFCGIVLLPAILLFSIFNTTTLLLERYYISIEQPK